MPVLAMSWQKKPTRIEGYTGVGPNSLHGRSRPSTPVTHSRRRDCSQAACGQHMHSTQGSCKLSSAAPHISSCLARSVVMSLHMRAPRWCKCTADQVCRAPVLSGRQHHRNGPLCRHCAGGPMPKSSVTALLKGEPAAWRPARGGPAQGGC